MGRPITGCILIATAGLNNSNRCNHRTGVIFYKDYFHAIIQVEYGGLLRFFEQRQYLIALILTVTQEASRPCGYYHYRNEIPYAFLCIATKTYCFQQEFEYIGHVSSLSICCECFFKIHHSSNQHFIK
jgi:hypothetical protein